MERMPPVTLFSTCLVQGLFPQVEKATRLVLERAGCQVTVARNQTCCGQPPFNAGLVNDAQEMGKKVLTDLTGEDPIVVPSGSCADMLTHHLPHLFADDDVLGPRAAQVAGRVRELSAFLVNDLGLTDLGARFPGRAAFHNSCHGMRNLGLGPAARTLLQNVKDLELVELSRPDECCGFGGLFALEMPEVSTAIMNSKLEDIDRTGASVLIGTDVSCLLHLAGGSHRRRDGLAVKHLSEILATS